MPRLRNAATGVVVKVSAETAALLGTDFKPVDDEQQKAPAKRAAKSDK